MAQDATKSEGDPAHMISAQHVGEQEGGTHRYRRTGRRMWWKKARPEFEFIGIKAC